MNGTLAGRILSGKGVKPVKTGDLLIADKKFSRGSKQESPGGGF